MDKSTLPPELMNLSPDQLAAAIDFANKQPKGVEPRGKVEIEAKTAVQPSSSDAKPDSSVLSQPALQAIKQMPEGFVDPAILSPKENLTLQESDLQKILDSGSVNEPGKLLEQVLNLSQKPPEDTAYKV